MLAPQNFQHGVRYEIRANTIFFNKLRYLNPSIIRSSTFITCQFDFESISCTNTYYNNIFCHCYSTLGAIKLFFKVTFYNTVNVHKSISVNICFLRCLFNNDNRHIKYKYNIDINIKHIFNVF